MTLRALVLVFGVLGLAAHALPLTDAQHGFSIDVPAAFERLPDSAFPGTLHAFRREATAELPGMLLVLRAIPRTLEQGVNLDPDHRVAEGSARRGAASTGATVTGFSYREVAWKGFPLEVMVMRARSAEGQEMVGFSTTLPLASGAMTLQVVGEARVEASVLAQFEAAVASVKGESNWRKGMTVGDAEKLGERVGFVVGSVGVPLCCLGSVGVLAWLLARKRSPKKS